MVRTRHLRHRTWRRHRTRGAAGKRSASRLHQFVDAEATRLAGTEQVDFFTASGAEMTATSHGINNGSGPCRVATDTTLPAGLRADADYYVKATGVNTFELSGALHLTPSVVTTDGGSGTHDVRRLVTAEGMWGTMRRNTYQTVQAASDIDDI